MGKVETEKFQQERRFFTIAPVLVLPFLVGIFWALGGGEGKRHQPDQAATTAGINTSIPEVMEKSEGDLDKLAFYNQAKKDSLEYLNRIKNDPYYHMDDDHGPGGNLLPYEGGEFNYSPYGGGAYNDPQEEEVMHKLQQLQQSLAQDNDRSSSLYDAAVRVPAATAGVNSKDINRLEQLMTSMQDGSEGDPEMDQLSGMLESILDIQHPDRVHERLMKQSEARRGQVFAVHTATQEKIISILGDDKKEADSGALPGFYGIEKREFQEPEPTSIVAVVHQTQTVTNGSIVKLRLLSDVYIDGHRVPANSFVFGTAQLNGERIVISIPGIQHDNSVFPVNLSVFDMDGLAGIHVPGAIARDVAKESGDRTLQSLGLTTFDPSLKAQAVSAGIEAGKTFLSRKVKLVKVTLKAGYKVLLVDGNKRND